MTPVHITIQIAADLDFNNNSRRGVSVQVNSSEVISADDVIQVLHAHGFDPAKVYSGLTRNHYNAQALSGGKQYEIYFTEGIPPPKVVTAPAPATEVEDEGEEDAKKQ